MQYRQLGPSGLHISAIGFGCMSLKGDTAADIRLLHQAHDSAINYFDTADLYDKGANEALLGAAFRGRRGDVILATKVGNQWRPDGSGWDWNPRKAYIMSAVGESLRRLGTDYIDLYQLHGGTIDDPIDETIEAFEQLKAAGKIRYYGISSIRPDVVREWVRRSSIVSVMMQYSVLDRRPEESCLPLLHENGIGVLARGSLAQGLLVDKPAKDYLEHSAAAVEQAAAAVRQFSVPGRGPAQTALQFVLQGPGITAAVAGIRTPAQLEDALAAVTTPSLTPAALESLAGAAPPLLYRDHR